MTQCRSVGSQAPELPQELDNIQIFVTLARARMQCMEMTSFLLNCTNSLATVTNQNTSWFPFHIPSCTGTVSSKNDFHQMMHHLDHLAFITRHSMKPQAASIEGNCQELLEVPAFQ